MTETAPALRIEDLAVEFVTDDGVVKAVDGVSYTVAAGEIVGVVGESGSGKSVTAMTVLGLIRAPGRVSRGTIEFYGENLREMSARRLRSIRGGKIAMIFQDPMTTLNPVMTVGAQIGEALRLHHRGLSRAAARRRAAELLESVGVPNAAARCRQYPHEFSGGMRQRAMIAMALANDPQLLIADEPTTALDVTIQAQVLELLRSAQQNTSAATILITHDLGVVAELADKVVVMYAGRVMETAPVHELFRAPRHPYTLGLLSSIPRPDTDEDLRPIPGAPPNLAATPSGCPFHPRCPLARDRCRTERPAPVQLDSGHSTACHFHEELIGVDAADVFSASGETVS